MAWLQDPELLSALEGLRKKDAELDIILTEIGEVVKRLGDRAIEMNRELKVQEMMAQDRACPNFDFSSLAPAHAHASPLPPADIAIRVGTQITKPEAQG